MRPAAPAPPWLDWGTDAFLRAQAARRPVLLSVVTSWSEACRAMDRESFAHPAVLRAMADRVVPVRVDADIRPDLAERYTLDGWPTTAFLTPSGALLGGGTFLGPAPLAAAIARAAAIFAADEPRLRVAAPAARFPLQPLRQGSAGDPTREAGAVSGFAEQLVQAATAWSGEGPAHPPEAAAVLFSLACYARTRDAGLRRYATGAIERLAWGPEWDSAAGGLFRRGRSGTAVERVKLLEENAALARVLAIATVLLGARRYRVRLGELIAFVERALADVVEGAFRPWAGGTAPPAWLLVDANARMAGAYLHAAEALDDPALAAFAVASLERTLPAAYGKGSGMAHLLDPRPRHRGMLADQVAVSAALLEAWAAAGDVAYLDLAEELMRAALRSLWDPEAGCLLDRVRTTAGAGDVGLLGLPLAPFGLNCEASSLLARIDRERPDPALTLAARSILAAFAPVWHQAGPAGGAYALASLELEAQRAIDART
jgi:uncharacterized protein